MSYKALMLSGLPNFVYTVGYTNASWTLKADLVTDYACRLLDHLDEHGYRRGAVRDPSVGEQPFMDFAPGYVLRAIEHMPKQGDRAPWMLKQNYLTDVRAPSAAATSTTGCWPSPERVPLPPVRVRSRRRSAGLLEAPVTRPGGEMGLDDKISNKIDDLSGKAKEGAGKATGNDELESEGKADQASAGEGCRREGQGRRQGRQGRPHEVAPLDRRPHPRLASVPATGVRRA